MEQNNTHTPVDIITDDKDAINITYNLHSLLIKYPPKLTKVALQEAMKYLENQGRNPTFRVARAKKVINNLINHPEEVQLEDFITLYELKSEDHNDYDHTISYAIGAGLSRIIYDICDTITRKELIDEMAEEKNE